MLILNRKRGEQIVIGKDITVTVSRIEKDAVKLGIDAPKDTPIVRKELLKKEQGNDAR